MKIEVDGPILSDAIKALKSLIGGVNTFIDVGPSFLKLSSTYNGNSFMTTVPIKVTEKSKHRQCAIDSTALQAAVSRLKKMEITLGESSLKVKSGRYTAEIVTHQFEAQQVVPDSEKKKGVPIKSKFLTKISELLPKLELQPLLSTYDYVPFGVKVTEDGAFLASFDYYQAAFVNTDEVKGKFEFVLPNNIFSMLAKEIKNQDYNLVITESAVYAYNDNFEYAAAMPQADTNNVSFADMRSLYGDLKKMIKSDGIQVKLKAEAINQIIENGKAIYDKDSTFEFQIKGDKCKLDLRSSSGKVSTMIMLEAKTKDLTFSCDFNFFSSLMKKAGQNITLVVIPDRMLLLKNSPVMYMMSLS
jgi:hypothetical protein